MESGGPSALRADINKLKDVAAQARKLAREFEDCDQDPESALQVSAEEWQKCLEFTRLLTTRVNQVEEEVVERLTREGRRVAGLEKDTAQTRKLVALMESFDQESRLEEWLTVKPYNKLPKTFRMTPGVFDRHGMRARGQTTQEQQ